MNKYNVLWHSEAFQDISEHILFLKNVNFDAAIKLRNSLFESVNSLKEFPESNPIFEMPGNFPFVVRKKIINKRYLILYIVEGNNVEVFRVLDSRKKFEYLI